MKLIGLCGKARCGKDSVAEFIAERNGQTRILSFAKAVKAEALKHGWNGEKDVNGRALLQYIGWRERQDDETVWIRKALSMIEQADKVIVITDVRYRNEAAAILERGGELWRIVRPGHDNGLTEQQKQHPSEVEMDNYNLRKVIVNDGSLNNLKEKVEALYSM